MKHLIDIGKQEAFDIALNGVIAQGRRSFDEYNDACVYNDKMGGRCAIKHIVENKLPGIALSEGSIASAALGYASIEVSDREMISFFEDLQSIHDAETFFQSEERPDEEYIRHFKDQMRSFAGQCGLEYKEA